MRSHTIAFALAALLAGAAPAVTQGKPGGCKGRIVADLGFSGLSFNQGHTYIEQDLTLFGTEPILSGIDPRGVAAGRLEEGDALVAVDDVLITTRAGAIRLAGLRPGTPVTLTVRRGGRNLDVRLMPGAHCESPPPPPPPPDRARVAARATLGVGISCSYCWSATMAANGTHVWGFKEPPEIRQVLPGSAAARAGLRAGDLIERIDGEAITSAEGGRRFGALQPGRAVRLGVLRAGRRLELTLVPARAP